MSQLEVIDIGVIYINPEPGYRSNFSSHSYVVELSEQELLCVFQRGQALYSFDSVLLQTRSRDGGRTWVEEARLPAGAKGQPPFSYHGPSICRMADGRLVISAIRWDRSDPNKALFNEETGGILASETFLMHSTDNGVSWSEPQVVDYGDHQNLTPTGPIVVLADGRWLLPCDQWHAFHEPGPYRPLTVALFSSDAGATWKDAVTFGDGSAHGKGFWHGRIIRLRDHRLFTLFWSADMKSGDSLSLHSCTGTPDGRDWSTPEPTGIPGQTNWPVDLGDGRMVAIYTVRETQPPGFFAVFSSDGGKSWEVENRVLIWDGTGRDKIGVNAPESYPRSHDTISFGAPTAIALQDGDVLCSFWCTQVSVTHIRYARLRLS